MTDVIEQDSQLRQLADDLNQDLNEQLVAAGRLTSPAWRAAFEAVPRHLFAPDVPVEQAYANDTVRTKRDGDGVTTSSVSAPWLQAVMLAIRHGWIRSGREG